MLDSFGNRYIPQSIAREDYYRDYRILAQHDYSKKHRLWSPAKDCFYCGRKFDKQAFRKEAHAVPRFFDSQLINADECDRCNESFANNESDLGLFFNPVKSALVSGTHKHKDHLTQMRNENGNLHLRSFPASIDEKHCIIHYETVQPRIDCSKVYCALLKAGLSIFSRECRSQVERSLLLVSGDEAVTRRFKRSGAFFIWGMNDPDSAERTISLLERVRQSQKPKYIVFLQYNRFYFQFGIPLVERGFFRKEKWNMIPFRPIVQYDETNGASRSTIVYAHAIQEKKTIQWSAQFHETEPFKQFAEDYKKIMAMRKLAGVS